jgi:HEAT repeat protein
MPGSNPQVLNTGSDLGRRRFKVSVKPCKLLTAVLLALAGALPAEPGAFLRLGTVHAGPLTCLLHEASFRNPMAEQNASTSNPWVEQLKSSSEKTRAEAAKQLGNSTDPTVIPALASALKDPSVKVRREVILALVQQHQPAALDALETASTDTDPEIRTLAVQCLTAYYTGEVPSTGFTGFVKKQYSRAKSHFQEDHTRIDPGVNVDPKVIAALQSAMNDIRAIQPAREAAKGLGILLARPAVADLVKAAHSTDEGLAREALNALAKIKESSAGPQLVDLLDSPNKEVKRDACVTVGILRTKGAIPKLQTTFDNPPDDKTKEKALEGLAYIADPVSIPYFTRSLWSNNKQLRTSAAEGLARVGDRKYASELQKELSVEKDGGVKLALEFALAALGQGDQLNALVNELSSKTRGDVAQSYLIELCRDKGFLPKIYPFLTDPETTTRRRLCTVIMYTGDKTSVEPMEKLSHDPNGDVASEALRALRAIRARAQQEAAPAPKAATSR